MSKVKLHENKTWTRKSTEYCEYDFPVESEKGEPEFKWQHGKINMEEWHKILSFFKWSYDETKSETQVRLLYNPDTKHWVAWAFPQEHGTGMTTKEIDNNQKDEQRARYVGYTNMGTVHHHCSTSAFQSGVDEANERSQDGIHITVGHMDKNIYDIDARVCWADLKYNCSTSDWFGHPEAWDSIPEFSRFIDPALREFLSKPPESPDFPEEWKENLIKVERNVGFGTNHYSSRYPRYGGSFSHNLSTSHKPLFPTGGCKNNVDKIKVVFDKLIKEHSHKYTTPLDPEELATYSEYLNVWELIRDMNREFKIIGNIHREDVDAAVDEMEQEMTVELDNHNNKTLPVTTTGLWSGALAKTDAELMDVLPEDAEWGNMGHSIT
tara:strand:+ start:4474 stop:5613 length:1140 start_codon:yes stop_codon:yes gene_type:complete